MCAAIIEYTVVNLRPHGVGIAVSLIGFAIGAADTEKMNTQVAKLLQHYSAYVSLAGLWLLAADRACQALDSGSDETDFYRAKLHSAEFYLRRVLPRASGHREALLGGAECLMALGSEHFAF